VAAVRPGHLPVAGVVASDAEGSRFAPLLIVWFGFGLLPKVLIAFLIAFFPIVINTVVGLAAIEQEKILLADRWA